MASRMIFKPSAAFRPAAGISMTSRQALVQRTFTSSSATLRQKEDAAPESYDPEKHKQDLLAKQKEGKGHWKPELASSSEESVKADRNNHEDIEKLQERTKKTAEETHKTGTSMHDGL
ncbi:Uu.00g063500.m01.CDS01 [Anthostomella pinea]|uniref:Uu.00g063500.m01.CDS01 n=1 Tax=Anthostomella pinea TaxID=933095 RepID=A0AAI8VU80_9PEZI|nr:Uu.00g063500.m01.CDS01 [Anthostomella pinea]